MPVIVAMLTSYYLLKNSSGDINLSFEFVSMAASQTMQCSFAVGQWTPLPRCLYGLLGWILTYPFLYFFVVGGLFAVKLIILYFIFFSLSCEIVDKRFVSLVALISLFLITAGGLGRFLIGSMGVLTNFDISLRTIGQIFLLLGILYFVKRKFIFSAVFFTPALLTASTSSMNIFGILGVALLISLRKDELKAGILWGVICLSAIAFQYWSVITVGASDATAELGARLIHFDEWKMAKSEGGTKLSEWSTAYHLGDQLGIFYISFVFVILNWVFPALASQNRLRSSIQLYQSTAIIAASVVYFTIAYFIEIYGKPIVLAESLMLVSPRRALYLPILPCVVILTSYLVCFVFEGDHRTSNQLTIVSFFALLAPIFFVSTNQVFLSRIPETAIIFGSAAVFLMVWIMYRWPSALRAIMTRRSIYLALLIGIFLRMVPLISADTIKNVKELYFSSLSRSYQETVLLEDLDDAGQKTVDIATWLNASTIARDPILLVNFGKDDRYRLEALIGRRLYTVDVFSMCALGCFYSKTLYFKTKQYFQNTTGIPWDARFLSFDRETRQRLINDALPSVIENGRLETIDGTRPKFIVTKAILFSMEIAYHSGDYYIYRY